MLDKIKGQLYFAVFMFAFGAITLMRMKWWAALLFGGVGFLGMLCLKYLDKAHEHEFDNPPYSTEKIEEVARLAREQDEWKP